MAVTYTNKPIEQKFFEALGSPELLERFNALKAAGVGFALGPFHVAMKLPGGSQVESQQLEMMPQAVVKLGTGKSAGYTPDKLKVTIDAIKAMLFAPGPEALLTADKIKKTMGSVDHFKATKVSEGHLASGSNIEPKPNWDIDAVVEMKDPKARRIGQLVSGTSNSYRVVAYSDKFVLAARKHGGQISLRVEGGLTPTETGELKSLGLDDKPYGMSGHLTLGEVPLESVFGAMFFNSKFHFVKKMANLTEAKL